MVVIGMSKESEMLGLEEIMSELEEEEREKVYECLRFDDVKKKQLGEI